VGQTASTTSTSSVLKAEPWCFTPRVKQHSVTYVTDSANIIGIKTLFGKQLPGHITTAHYTSPCYKWVLHPSGTACPSPCYWTGTWGISCSKTVLTQHLCSVRNVGGRTNIPPLVRRYQPMCLCIHDLLHILCDTGGSMECTHVCVCVYLCVYVCTDVCMYVCIHLRMYNYVRYDSYMFR